MTDPDQQPATAGVIDTSRHEEESGIKEEDVDTLAALTHAVGNHLFNVDHQYVGSNSNTKALQLDHGKIFKDVPINKTPEKRPPPPVESVVSPPVPSKPKASRPQPAPPPSISNDIISRIEKLESGLSTIRKARRIKRGVNYTVSSNSMKGVIKDAELLADYVITEVAKGVKTITIKRNDSKDT